MDLSCLCQLNIVRMKAAGESCEGAGAEGARTRSETLRHKYRRWTHLWRATCVLWHQRGNLSCSINRRGISQVKGQGIVQVSRPFLIVLTA
jgi:hypothetical protein